MPIRQPVDMVRVDEPWSVAHLPDGTQVKVKTVFDKIERELGPDGKIAFAPDGQPLYYASFKWVVTVDAPKSAMAPEKKKIP